MDKKTQATLLVIDMRIDILLMLPKVEKLIGNVAKALAKARKNNVPVIYVVVGFRPGLQETSMNFLL